MLTNSLRYVGRTRQSNDSVTFIHIRRTRKGLVGNSWSENYIQLVVSIVPLASMGPC